MVLTSASGAVISNATGTILAAVIGALISGSISLFIWYRQLKSPDRQRRKRDAWQKQAEELRLELLAQHRSEIERLTRQYETQIAYLQSTITSLQRLLNRERGEHER